MKTSAETLKALSKKGIYLPKEERAETGKTHKSVTIGIPKETTLQESRISLIPSAVKLLTDNGHKVVIEKNAGKAANFNDNEYAEAGAKIAFAAEEIFKADIILKVSPPTLSELKFFNPKQVLFSSTQHASSTGTILKQMAEKKITTFGFHYMCDEDGINQVVRSMGEISGSASILIAAEYLSNNNKGKGLMLGGVTGIPPVEVVIIGAGIVGEYAAKAALGLGADVKIFDNSSARLLRLKNWLSIPNIYTSVIQPEELAKRLSSADVVIGALRAPEGRTPCVVTEEMVAGMRKGSVIVDISIDQGGCFETSEMTSHKNPTYVKYGVTHFCVPNIPSRVAHTGSIGLSNILTSVLLKIGQEGGVDACLANHQYMRKGVYLYNGMVTNQYLAKSLNMPFKDLDLLMAVV